MKKARQGTTICSLAKLYSRKITTAIGHFLSSVMMLFITMFFFGLGTGLAQNQPAEPMMLAGIGLVCLSMGSMLGKGSIQPRRKNYRNLLNELRRRT